MHAKRWMFRLATTAALTYFLDPSAGAVRRRRAGDSVRRLFSGRSTTPVRNGASPRPTVSDERTEHKPLVATIEHANGPGYGTVAGSGSGPGRPLAVSGDTVAPLSFGA